MNELERNVGMALSMISTSGMPDYGRFPKTEDGLREMARVYTLAISGDQRLSPKIVELTAERYIKGKITVWSPGGDISPCEFPSSSQFRDACIQTWHAFFMMISVGETTDAAGCLVSHTIEVPKGLSIDLLNKICYETRKKLGIPEVRKVLTQKAKGLEAESLLASVRLSKVASQSLPDPGERKRLLREQAKNLGRVVEDEAKRRQRA